MIRAVLIVLSCMAIVAMSTRCDDIVKWRKTCSGNYSISCASNCSICTSPYGNCVRYEILKDSRGRVQDKHSSSYCTQSLSWSDSSCNLVAATFKC